MDPARQSMPEIGAYALLREVLFELVQAERALSIVEQAAPDPDRARHLAAIRAARAQRESWLSTAGCRLRSRATRRGALRGYIVGGSREDGPFGSDS